MMATLRYEAAPGMEVIWRKPVEDFLASNGEEPLIAWMLRESVARGSTCFTFELVPE